MRLDLTSKDEVSRVLKELQQQPLRGRFLGKLVRAWDHGTQLVVGMAVKQNFTGKGPFAASTHKLGVRTGRLRQSIRSTRPQMNQDGNAAEIETRAGSNVAYFAFHEFGFQGTQHVRGHVRKGTGARKFRRGKLTKASSKRFKNVVFQRLTEGKGQLYSHVKPHGRKVNQPARRMLGSVIDSPEGVGVMRGQLKRTADEVVKELRKLK